MTTAPPLEARAPDVAPRTPRDTGRRRVLAAVVGLTVVLGVLGVLWLAAPGALVRLAPASLQFEDGAPAAVVEGFGGPRGAYVVGYEHDTSLDVDVVLHNAGPLGVSVQDVHLDVQAAPLLVPAGTTAPGDIRPGGQAVGSMRLRFDNCEAYHEREAMLVEVIEVEARVLGRTVVEGVALDRPLMARAPMLWQCPDRTLDRSDDPRSQGAFSRDAP